MKYGNYVLITISYYFDLITNTLVSISMSYLVKCVVSQAKQYRSSTT